MYVYLYLVNFTNYKYTNTWAIKYQFSDRVLDVLPYTEKKYFLPQKIFTRLKKFLLVLGNFFHELKTKIFLEWKKNFWGEKKFFWTNQKKKKMWNEKKFIDLRKFFFISYWKIFLPLRSTFFFFLIILLSVFNYRKKLISS